MKNLLFVLAVLFSVFSYGQSDDQNYIVTKTYKDSTLTSIPNPDALQAKVQTTYFDGLGRAMQQILHRQSGAGNDMITHIAYDSYGRQAKDYLPIIQEYSLNYRPIDSSAVLNYYASSAFPTMVTTEYPYSEKLFERSPLNRVLKQAAPGSDWRMGGGHEVTLDYQTNRREVRLFSVSLQSDYTPTLIDNAAYYANFTLYKTITKDENWVSGKDHTTEEFKDQEGRVVLKRTYGVSIKREEEEEDVAHDTYYVYDDYGNLTYVLPPIVNLSQSISTSVLDGSCYQYKYDYRNRLIEKKLPGKQWEYIAYNSQDMPVATGPCKSPWGEDQWGWMITKYDAFGRVVYTGWMEADRFNSSTRATFETALLSNWKEIFDPRLPTVIDGVTTNYTNTTYPIEFKLLTINYYDTYDYFGGPSSITAVEGQTVLGNVKGLATGSWVRVLDTPTNTGAELSYTLYDKKGRIISTHKTNYLGGTTIVDSQLDFLGQPNYTFTRHKRNNSFTEIVIKDSYLYTLQDRLSIHKQQINDGLEELIVKNEYDDLGQLISKQVGGEDITTYVGLQKVDYRYNIRGWLTRINNVDDLQENTAPKDLFAFKINYNQIATDSLSAPVAALYNGNIAETFWRSNSDNVLRKYGYEYDALNRLREAIYQKPNSTTPVTNMYNERIRYDKNGNITKLNRNGDFDYDASNSPLEIDNLVYTYDTSNKNQLLRVQDSSTSTLGFKDDSATGTDLDDDYTYDANGNMLSDTNKHINSIRYNHLNLPIEIVIDTINKIEYLYNALGQKVRKQVSQAPNETVTDYLDGFQYTDGVLNFFPHAEGYVNATPSRKLGSLRYYYNYVYNYTDHLGNVRLSYGYDLDTEQLKILEENHYYPFGLKHTNYNSGKREYVEGDEGESDTRIDPVVPGAALLYKYKYNGMEYQDELGLNMYDYGARNYDPALGRWMNIDPLAEISRRWSPYSYAYDNPVRFTDPDGMRVVDNVGNDEEKEEKVSDKQLESEAKEMEKLQNEINDSFKEFIESAKSNSNDSNAEDDDQEGKKVTKKSAGIKNGDTAETMITKILSAMKSGDYIDGNDLDFLNSNIGYLIDDATMNSNGVLEVDRTMAGGIAGIKKDAKITLKPGTIGKMKGYNFELTGVSQSVKDKIYTSGFINDNKLYFYEKGKLLSVPIK